MTTVPNPVRTRDHALSALLAPWPTRASRARSLVNLTRELAVASFKLKYAGSVLGYLWSLFKPLLTFGMLYVVFALFLLRGRTTSSENFPVQLLMGIVLWTFFAEATSSSMSAIVSNGEMVRKAFFPRWILIVASTASAGMTLVVNLTLILVLGSALGWYEFGPSSALIVPLLGELYVLALGTGLLLAAVFVSFRDLGHVWEILLQLLFYASAIVFPLALIPAGLVHIAAINPLAQIVEDARRALVTTAIPWSSELLGLGILVPLGLSILSLVIGGLVFRALSRRFGERL
jgi:ABC-2 type transport system permease protein